MSLLTEMAADVRATSAHLPLPALRTAIGEARSAHERLVTAARFGGAVQDSLARLGSATTHLENGAGLIMRAQDEVSAYLAAIGTGRPFQAPPPMPEAVAWWARRVGELTGVSESVEDPEPPVHSAADLIDRITRAVAVDDRVALHRHLASAGAGLGTSLAGASVATVRRLVARAPVDALTVADLLPGLPARVLATLLDGARDGHRHDPTDFAIGATVLAARLTARAGHA